MSSSFTTLRRLFRHARATPLHPQWLLGSNEVAGRWVALHVAGRTLDIGCADRWIERLLKPGSEYIGLDYPATGTNLYGARPHLFADAAQLPLVDASVDTVTILEVVEHLRRPREALQEIARVLRPQGRLLLTVPFLYPIHDAPHDYQRLTIHGLIRDVEDAGLRIDGISPSLGSAETAGLLVCLSMAGMSVCAVKQRSFGMLFVPLVFVAIPLVNLLAWLGGRLLPSWDAITAGYRLVATKP